MTRFFSRPPLVQITLDWVSSRVTTVRFILKVRPRSVDG